MTGRSGGYRGLARGLAVTGDAWRGALGDDELLGAGRRPGTRDRRRTGSASGAPQASCGRPPRTTLRRDAGLPRGRGSTLLLRDGRAASARARASPSPRWAWTPGRSMSSPSSPARRRCQATEWSQYYSANFGGSSRARSSSRSAPRPPGPTASLLGCARPGHPDPGHGHHLPAAATRVGSSNDRVYLEPDVRSLTTPSTFLTVRQWAKCYAWGARGRVAVTGRARRGSAMRPSRPASAGGHE